MKKNFKIPLYAIDPLYGIILFNWFVFFLRKILSKKAVNVFVIHSSLYKSFRKSHGVLTAKLSKKKITDAILGLENVMMVGDYDASKIFVVSDKDITTQLENAFLNKKIDVVIGATASLEDDNEFSILDRALKATNLAQSKELKFKRL